MKTLNAAVIGVGWFGSLHAKAYYENPRTQLVAVVDIDQEKAVKTASQYGAKPYADLNEMLKVEKPDIVSVATPDDAHVLPAVAAAEAGVDILLEKPIAMTLKEADEIISAASRNGVKLMVNFILRFDPRYRTAYEQFRAGNLGEIVTMWARRATTLSVAKKYGKFSNLLHDTVIHDIDMFHLFAADEVREVFCSRVRKACAELGVDDAFVGVVKYRNGTVATFETSWVLPDSSPHWLDARFHVFGTRGAVYVDLASHGLEVVTSSGLVRPDLSNWPVVGERLMGNLRESINYFVDCVFEDRMPTPSGLDGRKALQTVLALWESAEKNKVVAL